MSLILELIHTSISNCSCFIHAKNRCCVYKFLSNTQ